MYKKLLLRRLLIVLSLIVIASLMLSTNDNPTTNYTAKGIETFGINNEGCLEMDGKEKLINHVEKNFKN
ncbi:MULTISPECIES: hypothetical protein [Bacillus]|uniref:hypothetical protein n=1 Tax=Bacillus TaxID=1386 RepID=UPI001D023790|nr:hypothetical protein [Bacillus pumilus]UDF16365.1 hypothetical protein LG951_18185 [Bacillus pumilus]